MEAFLPIRKGKNRERERERKRERERESKGERDKEGEIRGERDTCMCGGMRALIVQADWAGYSVCCDTVATAATTGKILVVCMINISMHATYSLSP